MADEEMMSVMTAPAQPPVDVDPKRIQTCIAAIEKFKKKDPAKALLTKVKELNELKDSVYKLINTGNYKDNEELMNLNMRIGQIAADGRLAEKTYNNLMETKFGDFKKDYERIYELAIREEGINPAILTGVLGTFTDYQRGRISYNKGTNMMLKEEQKRSNLPADFFNYLPEDG